MNKDEEIQDLKETIERMYTREKIFLKLLAKGIISRNSNLPFKEEDLLALPEDRLYKIYLETMNIKNNGSRTRQKILELLEDNSLSQAEILEHLDISQPRLSVILRKMVAEGMLLEEDNLYSIKDE